MLLKSVILFFHLGLLVFIKSSSGQTTAPCTIFTGESHIILNIVESFGNDTSQQTSPEELPISGEPEDSIQLDILEENPRSENIFSLEGKRLVLQRPLDRDEKDISSVMLQVTCTVLSTGRRKTIPVVVTVSDINDNAPEFVGTPYVVTVEENVPVNSTIFSKLKAVDPDSNLNGQIEYRIVPSDAPNDGYGFFEIDLPHQGLIKVSKKLDYETSKNFKLTIVASDRALDEDKRFSSTTTMTVHVKDSDDLDPEFVENFYTAKVVSGLVQGPLEVFPEKISAQDQDSLRSDIRYSFEMGYPKFYTDHFTIDPDTGVVIQTAAVQKSSVDVFNITVKAEEVSKNQRFALARLQIQVMAEDMNPPTIEVTSTSGTVAENSPIGTRVKDSKSGQDIQFTITDKDLAPKDEKPRYEYELTTNLFSVDRDGYLVVNESNLDRDAPNQPIIHFQIFAREIEGARKASSPVSMVVNLKDANDNDPILAPIKDIIVSAGNEPRIIAKLNATDNDSDKFIRFSLVHVSNNGRKKFDVNSRTGEVKVVAPVRAGEHYSLTLKATDSGGRSSQGIMEVRVSRGPNLRGPVFDQFLYEVPVSEGASKFAAVVTTRARDPEGELVRYTIVGGNELEHFQIEESTGVVRVMNPLDREENPRYALTVRAEDSGGKFSTAQVNIIVTDINDQNPEFMNLPYSFRVSEGVVGATVGTVEAEDMDKKENADVFYSVPKDSPFSIDAIDGEIRTKAELDFESQPVHYVVVTATDGGQEPRIATATVTVLVQDIPDEVPVFPIEVYKAKVPENVADYLVTTVMADDKDSEPSITYRLVQGDLDKFTVDPKTGIVRTLRGLDYERQNFYELIIGTEEALQADATERPFICTVVIEVQDRNDVPPVFTQVPRGNIINIRNDASVGSVIGSVRATDSDGTKPGNEIKYTFANRESSDPLDKSLSYFAIDEDTGDISVVDDLTKEVFDEYKLDIKAYDLGNPSLSTIITVYVRIQLVVTQPPDSGVGFEQTQVTLEVTENLEPQTVLKTLALEQKPSDRALRISCRILSIRNRNGTIVKDVFSSKLNENEDCELIQGEKTIDREENDLYEVEMVISTFSAFVNPNKMKSHITVLVTDQNDNPPKFIYDKALSQLIRDQYLAAIPKNIPYGQDIYKIKAYDLDSGAFGDIVFELSGDDETLSKFEIDPITGMVKNIDTFDDIDKANLPYELVIEARDNPNDLERSNGQRTLLMVNVLEDSDGIVLTIADKSPREMEIKKEELVEILQDQTKLVVTVNKMLPAMDLYPNGTCCRARSRGTDVYLHATDPSTSRVLPFQEDKLQSTFTGKQAASELKYTISGRLGVQASSIHEPYPGTMDIWHGGGNENAEPVKSVNSASSFHGYPAALIAFGIIVFALALAAMGYLCILKRKLIRSDESMTKTIVIPRYEPVFVEPNLKEYETQVLQMSVPVDDENNIKRQDSRDRDINLDSISYITKERLSSRGSPGSDETTSTTLGNNHYSIVDDGDQVTPIRNPLFKRSDSEEGLRHLSASHTNANVLFGSNNHNRDFVSSTPLKKPSSSTLDPEHRSQVDTTTQL